ncbi:MAG: hypothetical protein CO128_02560 [Ignavibacteriales bacterium CG_4_9_14_3_um_filter_30_11]|nr:MAG: hypothetical protein CO128_02560 [Ignavibacteriales bacterium CG_4_9_14_3_um_filter_30_11]
MLIKTISKIKTKRSFHFIIIISFLFLFLQGCKTNIDNRVSFNNFSTTDLIINFRGQEIRVNVGQKTDITEINKGTYTYSTSFNLPVGATSSTTNGDVNGTVIINSDTKVLVIYTSSIVGGVFTLSATLSTSESQGTPTSP